MAWGEMLALDVLTQAVDVGLPGVPLDDNTL
jgi:hypothetical protein